MPPTKANLGQPRDKGTPTAAEKLATNKDNSNPRPETAAGILTEAWKGCNAKGEANQINGAEREEGHAGIRQLRDSCNAFDTSSQFNGNISRIPDDFFHKRK